ncbi:MAG: transposase [Ferrovum myxofaciens]
MTGHVGPEYPAFDARQRLWRNKRSGFLFDHKALAKVFRAKMLESIRQAGLQLPRSYPAEWVVDCKAVGTGQKALVYLGRYLYRGRAARKKYRVGSERQSHIPLPE